MLQTDRSYGATNENRDARVALHNKIINVRYFPNPYIYESFPSDR
jgi:hypothetical protein